MPGSQRLVCAALAESEGSVTRPNRRILQWSRRLEVAARQVTIAELELARRLADTSAGGLSEAGPTTGGMFNDPVMREVEARAGIIAHTTTLRTAVEQIGLSLDHLDVVLRAIGLPKVSTDTPECNVAGCSKYQEHYRRSDGTVAYRGLCASHRKTDRRGETGNE